MNIQPAQPIAGDSQAPEPTTCASSNAKALLCAYPDTTATNSPHWADALWSCSPRPTDESRLPAQPPSTRALPPNSFDEARWPSLGDNSTAH